MQSARSSTPSFPTVPYVRFKWPSTLETFDDKVEIEIRSVPNSLVPDTNICFAYWYEDAPFEAITNVGCAAVVAFGGGAEKESAAAADISEHPSGLFGTQVHYAMDFPRPGVITIVASLQMNVVHATSTNQGTFIADLASLFASGVEQSASCLAFVPSSSSSSSSSSCVPCPPLPPFSSITTFTYAPTSDDVKTSESFPSGPSHESHYLVQAVRSSYDRGVRGTSSLSPSVLNIEGMSGSSYRHFINSLLASLPGSPVYLEIGVWAGSSFVSALAGNPSVGRAVAIDNWSDFGGPKDVFLEYVLAHVPTSTDVLVLERDCWSLSASEVKSLGPVDVYFFDGPHEVMDHFRALTDYFAALAETCIVLIDDWNFVDVRVGTEAAMQALPVDVLYERTITTTRNNRFKDSLWHNGIRMMVLRKKKTG